MIILSTIIITYKYVRTCIIFPLLLLNKIDMNIEHIESDMNIEHIEITMTNYIKLRVYFVLFSGP